MPCQNGSSGNQSNVQAMRLVGKAQGFGAVVLFQHERLRSEHRRLFAVGFIARHQSGFALRCDVAGSAHPILVGHKRLQHRGSSPGQAGILAMRCLGMPPCGLPITRRTCIRKQPAQAEQFGFWRIGHGFEDALHFIAITTQLRGLCAQQFDQWFGFQGFTSKRRVARGPMGITGTGSNDAA